MAIDPDEILSVLDGCCDAFTFPMLDNGYVYLAATRLSLYRSATDWAMTIEVFGFSPRAGLPDTSIQTFASRLHDRKTPERFVDRRAYDGYLANNPHNEYHTVFPVREGPWQVAEETEYVAAGVDAVVVRDKRVPLPSVADYGRHGIELAEVPRVRVFELWPVPRRRRPRTGVGDADGAARERPSGHGTDPSTRRVASPERGR